MKEKWMQLQNKPFFNRELICLMNHQETCNYYTFVTVKIAEEGVYVDKRLILELHNWNYDKNDDNYYQFCGAEGKIATVSGGVIEFNCFANWTHAIYDRDNPSFKEAIQICSSIPYWEREVEMCDTETLAVVNVKATEKGLFINNKKTASWQLGDIIILDNNDIVLSMKSNSNWRITETTILEGKLFNPKYESIQVNYHSLNLWEQNAGSVNFTSNRQPKKQIITLSQEGFFVDGKKRIGKWISIKFNHSNGYYIFSTSRNELYYNYENGLVVSKNVERGVDCIWIIDGYEDTPFIDYILCLHDQEYNVTDIIKNNISHFENTNTHLSS